MAEFVSLECDTCAAQAMGVKALIGKPCEICKEGTMEEVDGGMTDVAFYAASARRTEYIQLRLSPLEKKRVQEESARLEKTMSDYFIDLHREHMRNARVIKGRLPRR